MNNFFNLLPLWLLLVFVDGAPVVPEKPSKGCYDPQLVEISNAKFDGQDYVVVRLQREGGKIRAKYFSGNDVAGNKPYYRFKEWAKTVDNKIILALSGAGYSSSYRIPEGFTIDNGVVVNSNLVRNRMDALVMVLPNGGIIISNLKNGDLLLPVGAVDPARKFNLRASANDMEDFVEWAEGLKVSAFQTHLLAYKNQLVIYPGSFGSPARDRRFWSIGKDDSGKLVHTIIDGQGYEQLYEGSKKALALLRSMGIDVVAMINLDPGAQDVFQMNNSDCTPNNAIKGNVRIERSINLLTYYYQEN